MSAPFVAEIRIFAGNFAPTGWAQCNGQLLPISQNTALFSLLGTTYGGDGKSTFALPDLQGAAPIQQGQAASGSQYFLGEMSGVQSVTLISTEMPLHTHNIGATQTAANAASPVGGVMAFGGWNDGQGGSGPVNSYNTTNPGATLSPLAAAMAGSSFPHNNMMPSMGLTFIIALQGIFPARP
ncbi:MAG TPA: tail fiber protein [Caulobacteraceae bacterium]|nr:tail fiber protein [Caulobacteraceae bacterium]